MAKKKPNKKKSNRQHYQFDIQSGMKLPDVINWQEQEVMDTLSAYFNRKMDEGIKYVTMAEILRLFGHTPDPQHERQIFELADINEEPNNEHTGFVHQGIYYPMASYSYH